MVKALLTRIENAFKPDFLFASFLPTLLFVVSVLLLAGEVLGYEAVVAYLGIWSSNSLGLSLAAFMAVSIVILAYIIYGLRSWFVKLWAGQIEGPFAWLGYPGQKFYLQQFQHQRRESLGPQRWKTEFQEFLEEVDKKWTKSTEDIPLTTLHSLQEQVDTLHDQMRSAQVKQVLDKVISLYDSYGGDGNLKEIYRTIKQKLLDLGEQERTNKARQLAELDRKFGKASTIRPTALGNVIEAYNSYSYKRYGIEGETFWPHLESVLTKEYRERISDVKLLLDFFLTMATLGMLLAIFSFIIGPWLKFDPLYWAVIGGFSILISYGLYYKMGVHIAIQYGDLIRASFDLFRLDMLKELEIARPKDLKSETDTWKKLNRLVIFADKIHLEYRPKDDEDATA